MELDNFFIQQDKFNKELVIDSNLNENKNYTCLKKLIVKPNDYCLSDQFLTLLIDVNDLIISPSIDHYKTLFEDFISLGISLGFSINQIEEIFFKNDCCKIAL